MCNIIIRFNIDMICARRNHVSSIAMVNNSDADLSITKFGCSTVSANKHLVSINVKHKPK